MGSDEEYLDDFISSLMKEEAGEGLAPLEEGKEDSGLEEGTEPEDVDYAIEDLTPEEFDAGDFALEDLDDEEFGSESVLEEPDIDDAIEGLLEGIPEDFSEEALQENLSEEAVGKAVSEEPVLEDLPEDLALEEMQEEGAAEESTNFMEEEPSLDDFGLSDFQADEMESGDLNSEEESLISPDEVDAMFAAADAAADMDAVSDAVASEEDVLLDADLQTDEIFDFLDGMEGEEESEEFRDLDIDGVLEMPMEDDQDQPKKKKKREKKAKKEKKPLFGKKKKKKSEEENAEEDGTAEGETANKDSAEEDAEGMKGGEGAEEPDEKKEKGKGLFGRIMAFLTEADDEDAEEGKADGLEPSDENKNILKELDDEDKNKKKKKVKTKGDEEGKEKKEKKKKEKKKKEKPAAADSEGAETVKKGKKVSIKSILAISAFCLTITAMIIMICSIIPDFFEKRKAREAFYQSDYIKSYELMYGKKLDESDAIIYNKAKTILEMKRKLDSYHNYLGMGKEVQALDALMSGVEHYPEILAEAEEYRVTQEVNAIYESILSILNDKYSLAEPVAQTIVAYDDVTYTKRLESIVYNTPFIMPGEETEKEEAAATEDILPEEQELMEEEQFPDTEEQELPQDTSADEMPEADLPQEDIAQQEDGDTAAEPPIDSSAVDPSLQGGDNSPGEDVSTWTENSGFGSQGEQIQGIRQPIDVQIHGN